MKSFFNAVRRYAYSIRVAKVPWHCAIKVSDTVETKLADTVSLKLPDMAKINVHGGDAL